MSHEDIYGARWFSPGSGSNNNDTPDATPSEATTGEYYEYWVRSGTGRPRPPAISDARPESSRLLAETQRVTAEATRLATEATRLQAEVTRLAAENAALRADAAKGTAEEYQQLRAENEKLKLEVAKARDASGVECGGAAVDGGTSTKMVINEHVGSVSKDFWEGMTGSQYEALDTALKRIAEKICGVNGWTTASMTVIRDELAGVGIALRTAETYAEDQKNSFAHPTNFHSPQLKRIDYLLRRFSGVLGEHAYPNEMIRFVKRLMELRGFSC